MMTKLAILGSTGSIGTQTLDVVRQFPKLLKVISLSAGSNIKLLRQQNNFRRYTFFDKPTLTFEEPDLKTFICLGLAMESAKKGGTSTAVLTVANDIAVDAFLNHKITFGQIPKIVEKVLEKHKIIKNPTIKDILTIDAWSRQTATNLITT